MRGYEKPAVKTLTVSQILENLGPVSCGSGLVLGTNDQDSSSGGASHPGYKDFL